MADKLSLQTVLKQHLEDYARDHPLDGQRLKVCRHLMHCHTPALGGMQYQCDHCAHPVPQYHSCRDRHCPQCQHRASRRWCDQQQQAILPVTYYHLVFTLPHELNGWAQLHPDLIYTLLFQVAWQTLKTFAADPKRLGGQLGMTAVLHTWGQNLSQHVHLHCLIPGGVLTEGHHWKAARSHYLFPVRALSRHFRGRMVSALRACAKAGKLHRIIHAGEINQTLDDLMHKAWVVYSKPCLNHTQSIVGYLARYSHRIAFSDSRLISLEAGQVQFRYRDYRDNQPKVMTLSVQEFIRRYLQHILPKGFMRIRHYGLLSNRCRQGALARIRALLSQAAPPAPLAGDEDFAPIPCPHCHKGHLIPVRPLNPAPPVYPWPRHPGMAYG